MGLSVMAEIVQHNIHLVMLCARRTMAAYGLKDIRLREQT